MLIMKLPIAIRVHLASYGKAALAISSGLLRKCRKTVLFGAGRKNPLPIQARQAGGMRRASGMRGVGGGVMYAAALLTGCLFLSVALAHDPGRRGNFKEGEQRNRLAPSLHYNITGTITTGNNGVGTNMYVRDIFYDGHSPYPDQRLPHERCEVTIHNNPDDTRLDGIKHFYIADFRRDGNNELRGVRYVRLADVEPNGDHKRSVFTGWSDRDNRRIWGMSTYKSHIVIRLEDDHNIPFHSSNHGTSGLRIKCYDKNDDLRVEYEIRYIVRLHYDGFGDSKEITWRMVKGQSVGPRSRHSKLWPGVRRDWQGHRIRASVIGGPNGVTYTQGGTGGTDLRTQSLFYNLSGEPRHTMVSYGILTVEDENVQAFTHRQQTRALIQGATESMNVDGGRGGDPGLDNPDFSFDNERPSSFVVGSNVRATDGSTYNDNSFGHHQGQFRYRVRIEVRPPREPLVERVVLNSSAKPNRSDEELTVFMVKGREYFVQVRKEGWDTYYPDGRARFNLAIERGATSASGIAGRAATSSDGSAVVSSSAEFLGSPVIPQEAGTVAQNNDPNARTDLMVFPSDSDRIQFTSRHFRGISSAWARYIPSETGTYRVSLRIDNKGYFREYDVYVWGVSSLSLANCPGNANDNFDLGVAPEKFAFDQRLENRLFYAREVFPSDGEGVVLQPPLESRPSYILTARKYIGNDERITADITLSLGGARFHRPMRSEGSISIRHPDGRTVEDISVTQVSGGNVGDKEVTFRIDNDLKGRMWPGDRIEFIFPPLEGVNLARERDRVTITPREISVLRGAFPEGGISTCLSEVAGQGCVYARALGVGKVDLGPVDSSGRQMGTVAIIDPNDFTRLLPSEAGSGGAVVPLDLPGSLIGRNIAGRVNAIRVGTVGIEAGMTQSVISNTCLSAYRITSGVRPIDRLGRPLEFEYGDSLNIGLSPAAAADEGMYLMRKLAQDKKTAISSFERVPSDGVVSFDISRPEDRRGNWEFFFVPSGNSEMEYGDAWTLNAGIDFLYPAYRDILSEPISRSIILDHESDIGQPQARAYSIPPLDSPDGAFVRIRCEVRGEECQVSMECSNQTGQSWYGNLREWIPGGSTRVITPPEIAQALAGTGFDPDLHWGGSTNGRLSCAFHARPDDSISMQLFVRSAGTLINNTDVHFSSSRSQ